MLATDGRTERQTDRQSIITFLTMWGGGLISYR